MKGKRILALLLLAGAALSLAACDTAPAPEPTPTPGPTAEPVPTPEPERVLVVYFSRTGEMPETGVIEKGNTAILAEMIADRLGADLYEIRPADDRYPETYEELSDLALAEQSAKARPPIAGGLPSLDEYDTVFIGSPVWHGDWPMILYTFFEGASLAGKRLVPFCTHQGSGIRDLQQKLALICPRSPVENGFAAAGTDMQTDPERVGRRLDYWLSGLGFPLPEGEA